MEYDELELDTLGDQKTALFVILSDTDSTFNFVAALMYSQLFNLLCDKADDFYGGRLPVHVRLILDEFANIGQIPNFDKLIATIRSREISASIILQSQSQLKTIYKDAADTIVGNCDSTLFLGGKEKSTLKEISELLGKETIDLYNQSENRGSQVSHGLSYQKLGKDLLVFDEPTSGLDFDSMTQVAGLIRRLSNMGKVIFIVTHDFEFVCRTCSRVLHFDEGEMPDDVPVTMDALPKLRELFSVSEGKER